MEWLPDLVPYDSDWGSYSATLYNEYIKTYRTGSPITYKGKPVTAPRQPEFYGKSESFWHIIGGADNIPDIDRCARIRWARAIIEHCDDEGVYVFSERRGNRNNIVFWLKDYDYMVVLEERRKYYLLKTAYCIGPHKKLFLQRLLESGS